MNTELQHIATLHATIAQSSIFRIDGAQIDLPAALIALADAVHSYDGETESIWSSIGEHTECPLGDLIVGAYWSLSEWRDGQSSDTYAALSALGQVFSPGMSDGPEPYSGEMGVYEMINQHFDALHNPLPGNITPCHHAHPLHAAWLARVAELEAEGCDTSDAQSIADVELSN